MKKKLDLHIDCEYTSVNAACNLLMTIINIYITICYFNVNLGDFMNGVAALFTLYLK